MGKTWERCDDDRGSVKEIQILIFNLKKRKWREATKRVGQKQLEIERRWYSQVRQPVAEEEQAMWTKQVILCMQLVLIVIVSVVVLMHHSFWFVILVCVPAFRYLRRISTRLYTHHQSRPRKMLGEKPSTANVDHDTVSNHNFVFFTIHTSYTIYYYYQISNQVPWFLQMTSFNLPKREGLFELFCCKNELCLSAVWPLNVVTTCFMCVHVLKKICPLNDSKGSDCIPTGTVSSYIN